jgi:hypothetical protein
MLVTAGAVLPVFDALGVLAPVLVLKKIAAPALRALENDLVAGHNESLVSKLATGIEPVTSSLPRMRSTD